MKRNAALVALRFLVTFPFRILIFIAAAALPFLRCKSKDGNPTQGYIRDKNGTVYYRSAFLGMLSLNDHLIPEADYASFTIFNRHYAKDRHRVYYHQYFFAADPGSFEALDGNYGKDKNRVYFENTVLPEADPASIEFLPREGYILKDKNNVFHRNALISRNAGRLEKIGRSGGTYKSTDMVIVMYNLIEDADPASFELIDTTVSDAHFRDARRVYFNGTEIEGADPVSFVPLNGNFGKDGKQAYLYHSRLPGADAASFRVVSTDTAEDKFRKYSTAEYDVQPAREEN